MNLCDLEQISWITEVLIWVLVTGVSYSNKASLYLVCLVFIPSLQKPPEAVDRLAAAVAASPSELALLQEERQHLQDKVEVRGHLSLPSLPARITHDAGQRYLE